jgi:hypothetical protein
MAPARASQGSAPCLPPLPELPWLLIAIKLANFSALKLGTMSGQMHFGRATRPGTALI